MKISSFASSCAQFAQLHINCCFIKYIVRSSWVILYNVSTYILYTCIMYMDGN